MRISLILCLGLACPARALVAAAADYWPMSSAIVYHYEREDGAKLEVIFQGDTRLSTYTGADTCWVGQRFQPDAEGDIGLTYESDFCAGDFDPDFHSFDPAVKFLDLPLDVGKSWSTWSEFNGPASPGLFIGSVKGAETVTVPYGTFDVMVVELTAVFGSLGWFGGSYYLNRQVGPVVLPGGYRLVDVEGIVPTASSTWGQLKALYREQEP